MITSVFLGLSKIKLTGSSSRLPHSSLSQPSRASEKLPAPGISAAIFTGSAPTGLLDVCAQKMILYFKKMERITKNLHPFHPSSHCPSFHFHNRLQKPKFRYFRALAMS